ncbi:receptor expression-enhancing protein 3-A-like [Photinus pyralis]|uniref:receptor expression-enhancing protein 3-A-like n=1 Tax=Photinus pyralis TaxID=7054 RepID=UPI001266F84E|nr:receptor expression-enhancing protein 3-A-like [Photinus pyralis]
MLAAVFAKLSLLFGISKAAYYSFQAIQASNEEESKKWLTYWITFGTFCCITSITDFIFGWIPLYYEFKAISVMLLLSPTTNRAVLFYQRCLEPFLIDNEEGIGAIVSIAENTCAHFAEDALNLAKRMLKSVIRKFLIPFFCVQSDEKPVSNQVVSELDHLTEPDYLDNEYRKFVDHQKQMELLSNIKKDAINTNLFNQIDATINCLEN